MNHWGDWLDSLKGVIGEPADLSNVNYSIFLFVCSISSLSSIIDLVLTIFLPQNFFIFIFNVSWMRDSCTIASDSFSPYLDTTTKMI